MWCADSLTLHGYSKEEFSLIHILRHLLMYLKSCVDNILFANRVICTLGDSKRLFYLLSTHSASKNRPQHFKTVVKIKMHVASIITCIASSLMCYRSDCLMCYRSDCCSLYHYKHMHLLKHTLTLLLILYQAQPPNSQND